ncbi:CobW family GTP-binding protein [Paenibacillus oryzisoli]|uniref:CobW family GTP-binding protein n=1 Tax=Paenibacillus oryzisoli TaxID=1850517 RepID=UPI003D2BCFC6
MLKKVPVILLSGFLGSGKSTLLLRMLCDASRYELRPGVLMNEIGKQDVDGYLLQASTPDLHLAKLLDGCICCSKKSDISASLLQLLAQKPDVIFIELTGVANPEEIVDALTERELLLRVKLHTILTVLDAEHVLEYNSIFASDKELVHTLRRQIEVADLIILNKIDLVTDKQLSTIEKTVRKHNARSPILRAVQSEFDMGPLFHSLREQAMQDDAPVVQNSIQRRGLAIVRREKRHDPAPPSFTRIQTVFLSVEEEVLFQQRKLEQFLASFGASLLRSKGHLYIGPDRKPFLMQYAGKRMNWQPSAWQDRPYLVLIGLDLDEALAERNWQQLIDSHSARPYH